MYGPSPRQDLENFGMNDLDNIANLIMFYEPESFNRAFSEIFSAEIVRPECKNDAPIDCDRAHQATIDLCRGGK